VVPIRGDRVLVSGVPLGVGEYDLKSDGGLRTVVELPGSGYSTAVVAPDGRHLLTPGNDRAASVSLANLQPSGTDYIAESFVVGIDVAAAPISRVVVGTDTVYGPDVWLYRADNPQPYGKVDFGDGGPASTLYVNGVTFSPSGDRVFAITGNAGNNAGDDVFLRIVPAAR
jgi:hypothetical protein